MIRPFVQFQTFGDLPLRHAVTTRSLSLPHAGGPYADLNLAFHVDDDPARVRQNRRALAAALGYDAARLHAARQTHGAGVRVVTGAEAAHGALDEETAWPETDALVTAAAEVPLMIMVADCAPILLADFEARVLAVVHAGWRGAVAGIASTSVRAMQGLGARAEHIRAGIGPCLCAACHETGEEVADAAERLAPASVTRAGAKPHLSLDTLIRTDLASAGVRQVESMPHCPRCDNATFFSHRAQQGTAGRFALVAWWSEDGGEK